MRTTKEIKTEILKLVEEYTMAENAEKKPFKPGTRIPVCSRVYDSKERVNLIDSSLEFWLTSGRFCFEFEKKLGEFLGVKHVAAVNSGSSANLLAFMTLTSPLLGERAIKRGDEVICVSAAFPTTVSPIILYGAIPVFVDIDLKTLNMDVSKLESALSPKSKCIFIAHTLGNPFNLKVIKEFCKKHNLWLIEDNCDALGSEYNIDGKIYKTGTVGDLGTSSFYPAHHITMGEGGAVYTNDDSLAKIMISLRDWGRHCTCPTGKDNTCGHRFDGQYGELPKGYDHKYVYSHFGYNLQITDMQAAIGCAQLEKLNNFVERRRSNWKAMYERLSVLEDKIMLPYSEPDANPSWFGFSMTIRPSSGLERESIVRYIEDKGVQTRLLFSGNLICHPCFDSIRNTTAYRVVGNLDNTNIAMNNTFWVGVYPGMTEEMIDYSAKSIIEAVRG